MRVEVFQNYNVDILAIHVERPHQVSVSGFYKTVSMTAFGTPRPFLFREDGNGRVVTIAMTALEWVDL